LLKLSKEYESYYPRLRDELEQLYEIAGEARSKGLDPITRPESELTEDMAERVEKLVGPKGIAERIRELESMDRYEMAFKVAEEIIYGRFGSLERERAAEQAIRTALAIVTEGVTIAPIQGIPRIRIKRNRDGSRYLAVYFAGPIRPAGGTAQALTLVIADFVRRLLGLDRYKPSEQAVKRFVEEVRLYERRVRRFQFHVSDKDLELAVRNLPVESTGVATDPYEVSTFRDIPGIETNRVRGGALIVVVDGVVGRARKLLGICERLHLDGWEWLAELEVASARESSASFMEEIIVGRPVFSSPNIPGGFRLRYGRARNTGLAAVGIHPAAMILLNRFLTTGVQLRMDFPGKSAVVTPVDSIEPPVVKLRDGSVVRVETEEEAERLLRDVEGILFLGDILVAMGDLLQNNKELLPVGYDENQWLLDLERAVGMMGLEALSERSALSKERLEELLKSKAYIPTPREALALSEAGVPLHPRYTYMWSEVSVEELERLREGLMERWPEESPYEVELDEVEKGLLERLLVPHIRSERGYLFTEAASILERCLALRSPEVRPEAESSLELVRRLSGLDVRDKSGVYLGARMGRPEKAKERKLSPYVHSLFPIGEAGGPQRDLLKAERGRPVEIEAIDRLCPSCGERILSALCPDCGVETQVQWGCPRCGRRLREEEICPSCNVGAVAYRTMMVDVAYFIDRALKRIGGGRPPRIKGVKRLMNERRQPEPLEKGVLRARYDLSVFKDGTIRFDITDAPLTHFKPLEIGIPVERLKELGYTHDVEGRPLESPYQLVELKVQDVIFPEECGNYLVKVSRFLDDLLTRLYGLEPYYHAERREDLIGHLILGLAPHTSAAVVGRIIGYTKSRVCYAHPLWHAAKRRNCDGDEDAVMLALDPLLNFSREYLPEQIGGLMDAPLFIISTINPSEVDKEAHNVDVMPRYPSELYRLAEKRAPPNLYEQLVETIGKRLGTEAQVEGFGFVEECSNLNHSSHRGAYTSLKAMIDKLESQLELAEKIRAVDVKVVAEGVLTSHFLKDIIGNLRAYTSQSFRCVKCNKRFRRPPLRGVCTRCRGSLTLTVHRGGIEKYIEPARRLVERYGLDDYYAQRIRLILDELSLLFPEAEGERPTKRQVDLTEFIR
jgi:DNA polymerase II large subunit